MSRKTVYLALTLVGIIMPYSYFVPWSLENGLDFTAFMTLATANPLSTMLTWDVGISAVALTVFALAHLTSLGGGRIAAVIAGTFLIGVSCGLPLLLYFREGRAV